MGYDIRNLVDAALQQKAALQPRIDRTTTLLRLIHPEAIAVNLISMADYMTKAKEHREKGEQKQADDLHELVNTLLHATIGELEG